MNNKNSENSERNNVYLSNITYESGVIEERKGNQLSLTQKVFAKLLTDPDNQTCFDCGSSSPEYVSVNNGIFLCFNCACCIHQLHYGIEVSYIKSIISESWNHQQLRALINSGNKLLREFMEFYDLSQEPIQKRYNSKAAQYYRDRLKSKIDGQAFNKEKPEYDDGRAQAQIQVTNQQVLYYYLNYRDILSELFEQDQHQLIESDCTLNTRYEMYISDQEKFNEHSFLQGLSTNPNLPPKNLILNEPFCDNNSISNEDYLILVNKLNEFSDNTFTFGESILKRMEEVGLNDKLKVTADKIAKKSEEIGTSIFKRTRDSISQINQSSRVSVLKEKASDKMSAISGRFWSYFGSTPANGTSSSNGNNTKKNEEDSKNYNQFEIKSLSEVRLQNNEVERQVGGNVL